MEIPLKDLLKDVNETLFLPTLQRDYVWLKEKSKKKIELFFDSLMRKYPVGQITIWKPEELPENLNVYEFLRYYSEKSINECGSRKSQNADRLVLDGQQRITSLYIALKGYKENKNSEKEYLYINLLFSKSNINENLNNCVNYQFEFLTEEKAKTIDEKHYWYKVEKIFYFKSQNKHDDVEDTIDEIRNKINHEFEYNERNIRLVLETFVSNISDFKFNVEYIETNDIEDILEVFVRLNSGGVVLEKSDLLLSFMETNKDLFENKGAREVVANFVDEINKRSSGIEKHFSITKDFLLKACLMLADLDIKYDLGNFTSQNLKEISKNWENIKKNIKETCTLLDRYRLNKSCITARNAILPICYYIKINKLTIKTKNKKTKEACHKLIKWLIRSLITNEFGGSSDTILTKYRNNINTNKFFESLVNEKKLEQKDIEDLVLASKYKGKYTRLLLMICLNPDTWELEEDHIVTQETFETKEWGECKKYMNNIGNLQMLGRHDNSSKGKESEWNFKNLSKKDREKFLYPRKYKNITPKNFINFVKERENLIIKKICNFLDIKYKEKKTK